MVIGHECAGIVEEVGSEVKNLVPGDRVALEPGISCWRCDYCKEGRYNLCPDMKFFATPPVHGSLANQVLEIWTVHIFRYGNYSLLSNRMSILIVFFLSSPKIRWCILQIYVLSFLTV